MKKLLRPFIDGVGKINETVGRAVAWLTSALVLLVCADVLMRYFFNTTAAWVMELEWHLFAFIFLLGAAYAFKHDRHVRVDLFYDRFSPRDQAWVNLVGGLVFLLPWCMILIYVSFQYTLGSYQIGEGSPNPGGLPYRFIVKGSITVGLVLLLLQALASIAEAWLVIQSRADEVEKTNQQLEAD